VILDLARGDGRDYLVGARRSAERLMRLLKNGRIMRPTPFGRDGSASRHDRYLTLPKSGAGCPAARRAVRRMFFWRFVREWETEGEGA
jgi:hypothetical protein